MAGRRSGRGRWTDRSWALLLAGALAVGLGACGASEGAGAAADAAGDASALPADGATGGGADTAGTTTGATGAVEWMNGRDDDGDGQTDEAGAAAEAWFAALGVGLDDLYWGEFHGHTSYSIDAAACGRSPGEPTPDPWQAYELARDETGLDFVALNDHDYEPNVLALPSERHPLYGHCAALADGAADPLWASLPCIAQEFDEDGRFVVFPGWEYTNTPGVPCAGGSTVGYGHKNVIFRSLAAADLPEARWSASCAMASVYAETAADLWERLAAYRPPPGDDATPGGALTIIHTPANLGTEGRGHGESLSLDNLDCACEPPADTVMNPLNHSTDWDVVDEHFTRHVEIISKWGCSEGPAADDRTGCIAEPAFEYTPDPASDPLTVRGQLQQRWVEGGDVRYALGFVGGTDGHDGRPGGDAVDVCGMAHRGGITGILAPSRTRDALWTALWQRRTVAASTGATRLGALLGVESDGRALLMGDVGSFSGPVHVRAVAADGVAQLALVVDGCVVAEGPGPALEVTLALDPARHHYVYVRGSAPDDAPGENDEHERRVWTSPVYLRPAD